MFHSENSVSDQKRSRFDTQQGLDDQKKKEKEEVNGQNSSRRCGVLIEEKSEGLMTVGWL